MRLAELIVFLVCIFVHRTTGQSCQIATSEDGDSLPSFSNPGNGAPRINISPIQAIITSYQFQCCGIISGWSAFVEPGGMRHEGGAYSIAFQVWRPTLSDGDRYVKVGENMFNSVTLSEDSLINVTPAANVRLHFQPGDVVGYYLENSEGSDGGLQLDSDFTQDIVWYAVGNTDLQSECVLKVGNTGDLSVSTTLGPIISLSFTTSTTGTGCSSTFTSNLFCSTSTSTFMPIFTSTPTTSVASSTPTPSPSFSSLSPSSSLVMSSQIVASSTPTPISSSLSPSSSLVMSSQFEEPRISTMSQSSANLCEAQSDCPQSTTLTEISTASTSPPSPTSNPTLFSPSPTIVVATEQVTSDSPLAGGNSSVGLITGVTVSALVIGLLAFMLITVLLVIVINKRRLKQSQEIVDVVLYSAVNQTNEQHDQIKQNPYYDTIDPMTELSTSTNEAYGKHKEATATGEDSYCCVNDHANDPKILTSQNVAYGDIPTSTTRNDEQVNEGLNNPRMAITQSEAYGDTSRQISSSRGTGSLDDTRSIPTTRNEAYTSVSTNTESVDTEETYDYDYVINL